MRFWIYSIAFPCLPDVWGVKEFFSLVSGMDVILESGFVDLTFLAVLTRYKFHSKNMTALGVQVMGTLLNKMVSKGDELWGLKWSMIPDALKSYALGDIKFGFISYNVLAGLLLRDMFPDLDVLCWYLETDQSNAVTWFLDWVLKSLEGVEVYQAAEEESQTRARIVRSLRLRGARDRLEAETPMNLKVLIEVMKSWPSITNGGCRVLLQAREWFLKQSEVLSQARISWSNGVVLQVPRESDKDYARFRFKLEDLSIDSLKDPIRGVRGMWRPSGMEAGVLRFDPSVDECVSKGEQCVRLGKSQRWCILEWARLNPERFKGFFVRMIRDVEFRLFYKTLYDCL